jgi:hypothetical protein
MAKGAVDTRAEATKDIGSGKKKERRGFKSDRLERFQVSRLKKMGKKVKEANKNAKPVAVKEVKFDDAARKDFLLGFHKRKNERRITAYLDVKRKQKKENTQFRREQREEARKAYNTYAKVPILPDYSYRLPNPLEDAAAEAADDAEVFEDEEVDEDSAARASKSQDFFPQEDSLFGATEGVSVCVQPLRQSHVGTAGAHDFSDLPKAVAEELRRLQKAERGPARTKPKVSNLKTLEKIRKIQKHSRKGHGKKGAKGKGKK